MWGQSPWARHADMPLGEPRSTDEPKLAAPRGREVASLGEERQRGALAQAKTQWFFGEWGALAKVGPKTLYEHAERDRLALLVGAAHAQLGSFDEAREHVHLALKWGCPPHFVAEVLIAGVHNSLGRAASVTGQQARAQKHFESAVMIEAFGSEGRLISDARRRNQLSQLGVLGNSATQQRNGDQPNTAPPSASAQIEKSPESAGEKGADIFARLREQGEAADRLPHDIAKLVKKEILNATKQLEAFIEVRDHLGTDDLIGDLHGWPISPDLALYLVQLIETNDYDVVIEFGSGTSTVLIARALAKCASRRHGKAQTVQVAFEHLAEYHAQTLAHLRRARLADSVQLVHAPLVPFMAPNRIAYAYYDCQRTLREVANATRFPGLRILVLVDGPPGSIGRHSRYAAVPIVRNCFSGAQFDVLLDDYLRQDEREIAQLWLAEIHDQGLTASLIETETEKGACLIRIR
jgi:hypothetical protein